MGLAHGFLQFFWLPLRSERRPMTCPGDRATAKSELIAPDPTRQEALAEFAAGAGHEINNPLAIIAGRAQQLLVAEADPAKRQSLATILAQAHRIRDMIGDLMTFARPPEPQPRACDLAELVESVLAEWRPPFEANGISFEISVSQPAIAYCDRDQIGVALAELFRNALEASPPNHFINVMIHPSKDSILCEIVDQGGGFSPEQREHAFDPFFSGRQAGRGLGFGLPKAWKIITLAGGTIEIDTAGRETRVRVQLPAHRPFAG